MESPFMWHRRGSVGSVRVQGKNHQSTHSFTCVVFACHGQSKKDVADEIKMSDNMQT